MTKDLISTNTSQSKNALKHAIYSNQVVLQWENEAEFNALHQNLEQYGVVRRGSDLRFGLPILEKAPLERRITTNPASTAWSCCDGASMCGP